MVITLYCVALLNCILLQVDPFQPNKQAASKESYTAKRNHSGFIQPILRFGDARHYQPHNYKYVIVPLGE